jgi:hypothetical protein
MKKLFSIAIALGLVACGGGSPDPGDDDPPGDDATEADAAISSAQKVNMTFSVTNGVRQSPNLVDPLMGAVYGQLFKSSEVTLTGPIDGAMEYGSVEVTGVDLITATTAGMFTSLELPANDYTFLGFFDVDGNGATDRSPDAGDPVTIPITNTFTITSDQTAPIDETITFDFVYN